MEFKDLKDSIRGENKIVIPKREFDFVPVSF
jgi:hypothetical protein